MFLLGLVTGRDPSDDGQAGEGQKKAAHMAHERFTVKILQTWQTCIHQQGHQQEGTAGDLQGGVHPEPVSAEEREMHLAFPISQRVYTRCARHTFI